MPRPAPKSKTPLPPPPAPSWVMGLLLVAGAGLFAFNFDSGDLVPYLAGLLLGGLALIPPVFRQLSRRLEALRSPTPKVRRIIALALLVVSARYFMLNATRSQRPLIPCVHDEFMYLIQSNMLAQGRLWMPRHELADFFDSFFVIVKPVYAASYFPGTAIFYAPGAWADLAPWSTALIVSGAVIAMLYLVLTELIDGLAGLLGAILAMGLLMVRLLSVMAMSHVAMLLLLLLALWAYLNWRKQRRWRWAMALGAFAGWAAITRPIDAACLIFPIGLAMLWDLRRAGWKPAITTIGLAILPALPFLSLQLILNKGVTGQWFHTPIAMYDEANLPGLSMGFGPRAVAPSQAALPQVRMYYEEFLRKPLSEHGARGFWRTWLAERWLPAATIAFPVTAMFILLPLGLPALRTPPRWALAAGVLTLPLAYVLFPTYLRHYALGAIPAFVLLMLLGQRVLWEWFRPAGTAAIVAIVTMTIASLPHIRGTRDPHFPMGFLVDITIKLAELEHTPAVVLFKYVPGVSHVHEEPVFNIETAWPDDARVIRAHDLGDEQNRRIFAYYAKHQPNRFFYRYDRVTAELKPLGWAKDLAK